MELEDTITVLKVVSVFTGFYNIFPYVLDKAGYFIIQLEGYCLRIVVCTPQNWSDEHSLYAEVNVKTIETEITED